MWWFYFVISVPVCVNQELMALPVKTQEILVIFAPLNLKGYKIEGNIKYWFIPFANRGSRVIWFKWLVVVVFFTQYGKCIYMPYIILNGSLETVHLVAFLDHQQTEQLKCSESI